MGMALLSRLALSALALGLALAPDLPAQDAATAAKVRQAAELVRAGKPDQAIPIYRELANAFPGVPSFGINVAIAQYKAGRYRDAIAQCKEVLRLRPDLFTAWLFLGASQVGLGDQASAIEPLGKAVALAPDDLNARTMLADALFSQERYRQSAGQFEEAAQRMPGNARVWQGIARSYDALAAELFDRLARTAPDSSELAALTGDFERGREQWARAFESYRRALAIRPAFRELHAAIATVYERTGHSDWAALERTREPAAPANCAAPSLECDFAKGMLHEVAAAKGETPEALYWRVRASRELEHRAVEKLGQLPPSPERFETAALASERAGQYREAAAAWKEALQLAPGNAEFERQLAVALCRSNDCGSALSLVKNLLDREPANAQLNYLYGAALNSTQRAAQALPFLEAAVRLDGSLLDARAALGQAYLEAGSPERAIPELEAAVAQDPEGTRRYQLARAYQAAGKQQQAAAALRAYREFLAKREAGQQAEPRITPP